MLGAAALSGTVGSLLPILDQCLVNGFDTRAASSIVVFGGIATVSYTGITHSARLNSVILVTGVTDLTALNGEQKVTAVGFGFIKFATSVANGTATGTISFKMAPLGWAIAQTGTNLRAYKSTDVTSTGCILRVDDTVATSCRVVGYESMTDINTGLGAFPTASQQPGGGYWVKSITASAGTVLWSIHGDGKVFYLNVQPGSVSGAGFQITSNRMFGDIIPFKPGGDPYACVMNYSITSTIGAMHDAGVGGSAVTQFAQPRDFTGLGSAVISFIYPYNGTTLNTISGITSIAGPFPSQVDGGIWLSSKYLNTTTSVGMRGQLPGVLHCGQSGVWASFKMGDTTPGSGPLAGRSLRATTAGHDTTGSNTTSSTANTGIMFFDDTGPWR
jgi:hypothetical protein